MNWILEVGHKLQCAMPADSPMVFGMSSSARDAWIADCGWWYTTLAYWTVSLLCMAAVVLFASYRAGRIIYENRERQDSDRLDRWMTIMVPGVLMSLAWAYFGPLALAGALVYYPARGMMRLGEHRTTTLRARQRRLDERERELNEAVAQLECELRAGAPSATTEPRIRRP